MFISQWINDFGKNTANFYFGIFGCVLDNKIGKRRFHTFKRIFIRLGKKIGKFWINTTVF
ncbi:hypothetical protein NM2001072_2121 [Neisseria meningitidis 2001072]|nr:hypothetical protein NM2001072_2121 [Neisseria meningitidis 2001072]